MTVGPLQDNPVVSSERQGAVAFVTLQRSGALNALSVQMAKAMTESIRRFADDPSIWVIVLRASAGRAFSVGADLKETIGMSEDELLTRRGTLCEMFASIRAIPQASIASVFGLALGGGCEIALSCDLIVAAEDAIFGLPELRVGVIPAGGGTRLLSQAIGVRRAKELMFTAKQVNASSAQALGIVSRLVPRTQLDEATMELALEICRSSPSAVRIVKRVMDRSTGVSAHAALAVEEEGWKEVGQTSDRNEGIAAFVEKRTPRWENR